MEERLPWFSILLPKWFQKQYVANYQNLLHNAKLLATPFDIHETLLDLLQMGSGNSDISKRSLSLFSRIPSNRSCSSAGIDAHWCSCLTWEPVSLRSKEVTEVVEAIIERINSETARERKSCTVLKLSKVKDAKKAAANDKMLRFERTRYLDGYQPVFGKKTDGDTEYQVTFQTVPGKMVYEATVIYNSQKKINVDLKVVSILTKYGDRPHCIADRDPFLRKWCICHDKV